MGTISLVRQFVCSLVSRFVSLFVRWLVGSSVCFFVDKSVRRLVC